MHQTSTKDRIVDAADRLFYEQGFEHTSFAQIAKAVGISRGNFYHHFKTKDAILDAVIQHRVTRTHAMLANWEVEGETPLARIQNFANILMTNRAKIMQFGCPVGTLSAELAKLEHPAEADANTLFTLFRTWLTRQFKALGRDRDADALAMHVLAWSQGVATLANAFHDEAFIRAEIKRLHEWLNTCTSPSPQP